MYKVLAGVRCADSVSVLQKFSHGVQERLLLIRKKHSPFVINGSSFYIA